MIAEVTGIERRGPPGRAAGGASPSRCSSPATTGARVPPRAAARGAATTTCCPASAAELHLALAQAFEQRPPASRTTRSSAPRRSPATTPPPAISRRRCARASAPRGPPATVHAYGEAADLAERALELWPRVPDAEQLAGLDHVDLSVAGGPGAHARRRPSPGRGAAAERALEELDPERDPRRYSRVLGASRPDPVGAQSGRGGSRNRRRALALLPGGEAEPRTRPASWPGWRAPGFSAAASATPCEDGEEALAMAVAAGASLAETEVLNTLGMAADRARPSRRGRRASARAIDLARAPRRRRRARLRLLQPRRPAQPARADSRGARRRARGSGGDPAGA